MLRDGLHFIPNNIINETLVVILSIAKDPARYFCEMFHFVQHDKRG